MSLASVPACQTRPAVRPTYGSGGLLYALARNTAPERSLVFHFAGRAVAQLDLAGITETWKLLTTDHLGTPIAATALDGTLLWEGGFEPFGADWSGASAAGVFLRFPGQWEEGAWGGVGAGVVYNVHRWYEVGIGRYTKADPIGLIGSFNLFSYVDARPTLLVDPTGLQSVFVSPQDLQDARERACAQGALARNYFDLREANRIGADGYFHCKGNCEASKCGPAGDELACVLSDLREFNDRLFKGDPLTAIQADQEANLMGRLAGRSKPGVSCKILCAQLRPKGLPAKY